MVFEHIEKLKLEYTDKFVVVDERRPELRRFKGQTGTVRTVNMNGRALVEFDAYDNIGWYDIEIDYLRSCLETLSPKARKVVNLKYVEGLSGVQIAELVGSKVHSVYVSLTRAHRSLEACVQKRRLREEHGRV